MRMDGDQAYRLFAVEGAKPFAHFCRRKTKPSSAQNLDGDEIAIAAPSFLPGRT